MMKEFRVKWQQCPYIHHEQKVVFIEALTSEDAKVIAKDHIERRYGVTWFSVFDAVEVVPIPQGRVIGV